MMDFQDVPVTLVIKAPNQRMEDLTVDCMLGWTIKKLKQHLEIVYPSKPKQNEQRLIYSGKLLQDHLTLKEILHQFDMEDSTNRHTVHLVCSGSKVNSSSSSQKAKEGTPKEGPHSSLLQPLSSTPESSAHVTSSNTVSASPYLQGDGLRFRGHTSDTPSTESFPATQMPYPQVQTGYQYTPEQYAWVMQHQQLYSQYMMQYMQYYQGIYGASQHFANGGVMPSPFGMLASPFGMPPTSAASPVPQTHLPQQQQAQPQAAQQPAAPVGNNNAPRQNMRMNAQGGMEEDDDDEGDPRDWLHHTYFLMRLLTFLGILFFYSSVSRFLMVFAGSFAIYFFQKLRKYMQRIQRDREQQQELQQQQQEQHHQQPQEVENRGQPDNEQDDINNEEIREDQTSEEQPPSENQTAAEAQEEGSRMMKLFLFISRTIQIFFTSLVPAPAELLDAN